MNRLAVIRVRGRVNVSGAIEDTLKMLGLTRVNSCAIIDERDSYSGMLQKVKDYVTWGPVDEHDVALILKNRGELRGKTRLTDEYLKKNSKFKNIEGFARDFVNFKAELKDIPNLKPVFRLHPPRKGYKRIKRSYKEGGALGYRGKDIKDLIYRMR